jgi:NAD-dependent deacetylase
MGAAGHAGGLRCGSGAGLGLVRIASSSGVDLRAQRGTSGDRSTDVSSTSPDPGHPERRRSASAGRKSGCAVVWFGEVLPAGVWYAAEAAARDCDLVLVAGTSALVYPAAELPLTALARGAAVVQVNPGVSSGNSLHNSRKVPEQRHSGHSIPAIADLTH